MRSEEELKTEIKEHLNTNNHHVRIFDGEIYTCLYYCGSHDDAIEVAKEIRKQGYYARIHDHVHDHPNERWDTYIGRYKLIKQE